MSSGVDSAAARIALIGFCYDDNSSFLRGAAGAPPLIRAALFSDAANLWTESGIDLGGQDIFFDAGDVLPSSIDDIEDQIRLLLARGVRPISLGGDHSITYPIVRTLRRDNPSLSILH